MLYILVTWLIILVGVCSGEDRRLVNKPGIDNSGIDKSGIDNSGIDRLDINKTEIKKPNSRPGHTKPHHNRPNILFILSDDHGWNDVDWHDPTMETPVLNRLAHSNHTVQLDQAYVNQLCSPTRSALLSGHYPYHLGTQEDLFQRTEPSGVPLEFDFIPQKLAPLGYRRHMIGKWHVGYCKHEYLPTRRGFETFYGYYSGDERYYSHIAGQGDEEGLDFFMDTPYSFTANWGKNEQYSTGVFANETIEILQNHPKDEPFFIYLALQAVHAPLQTAPLKYTKGKCSNITRKARRTFCGMVRAMDAGIGRIVEELRALHLYNNTIIIFTSDNGGNTSEGGNNFPLRGAKGTLWEGGTRVNTFVHAPAYIKSHAVRTQMFSVVDWLPTILGMAGDGYNLWEMIKSNSTKNNRKRFVYNINSFSAAIREGDFKLIIGLPGKVNGWVPPENATGRKPFEKKGKNTWLFDIKRDPNERRDISSRYPRIVHQMTTQLRKLSMSAVPLVHKPLDERGLQKYCNGTYASGWC